MKVMRLRDLHKALCEAMEVCSGDEPVVIDGVGVPMPITGLESAGLRLTDNGRMKGAVVVRDEDAAYDCGIFVVSHPQFLGESYWHRVVDAIEDAASP